MKSPAQEDARFLAFIGHFLGKPAEWFLVWAASKAAAIQLIRDDLDEPDQDSVRAIEGEGYFVFRASASTSKAGVVELEPPLGEYVILQDPGAQEWILRRLAAQGEVKAARRGKRKSGQGMD